MYYKSESEIVSKWKGDLAKPKVSISCATFNQKEFICNAIDSFLMQETDFPFEILLYDDASTDGTTDIVNEYVNKYPNIIKAICQVENQYSKNVRVNAVFNVSRAKGDYIAFCEGDDFWTSVDKLQLQVEALDSSEHGLCFHPTTRIFYESGNLSKEVLGYGYFGTDSKVIGFSEILKVGGSAMGLSSMLIRKSVLDWLKNNHEEFFTNRLTHFYYQLVSSMGSGAIYIPQYMSMYRCGVDGSWTNRSKYDFKYKFRSYTHFIVSLHKFLSIVGGDRKDCVQTLINKKIIAVLVNSDAPSSARYDFYKENCIYTSKWYVNVVARVISSVFGSSVISLYSLYKKVRS